jgi:hypothetical protein
MMQLGAMPLASFRRLHPEAKVTPEELAILKTYLAPWSDEGSRFASTRTASGTPNAKSLVTVASRVSQFIVLTTVKPECDGFLFDSNFETWKLISTTDRGDNNTFRFVLGNDIAVKAVQSGNITPWPEGARLAKVAWQQELGSDGLIHPGQFVQIELMLKNTRKYKNTDGWGWGRWRGLDLKPYGKDARFVNECTGCHLPVRGNDYVYTLPITTSKIPKDEIVNNAAAALPSSLPYQPLGWSAITVYVDPMTHTTATLYGNDIAMRTVMSMSAIRTAAGELEYAGGSVLALVTWVQRQDPHWFGARIPLTPKAVEFVHLTDAGTKTYSRYDAAGQLSDRTDTRETFERTDFIVGLSPAQFP